MAHLVVVIIMDGRWRSLFAGMRAVAAGPASTRVMRGLRLPAKRATADSRPLP